MVEIRQDLHTWSDNFHRELKRLLELLAAQRAESHAAMSVPASLHGETVEALAVLAAQRRVASEGAQTRGGTRRADDKASVSPLKSKIRNPM